VTDAPSEWATARFGTDAESVAVAVVAGLHEAHGRALRAHAGGGLKTADAYGIVWLAATEEILARIAGIEGASRIKPDRARYTLGVVNHNVIYPVRIATDLRKPPTQAKLRTSGVRMDLFSLAPNPTPTPLTLFDDWTVDAEQEYTLKDVEDLGEARLVLVAYVSSPDGGLLAAWWGEAALLEDGQLKWKYRESLDLSRVVATAGQRHDLHLVTGGQADKAIAHRFSDAPLEDTPLGLRNPLITPISGPQEPDAPTGSSDDES
jgi:hypothetical protein